MVSRAHLETILATHNAEKVNLERELKRPTNGRYKKRDRQERQLLRLNMQIIPRDEARLVHFQPS